MQVVRYLQTWFHVGAAGHSEAKFEAGKFYSKSEETLRHVAHGIAELFEAPDDADKAAAAAEAAKAKADKAAEVAQNAAQAASAAAAVAESAGDAAAAAQVQTEATKA